METKQLQAKGTFLEKWVFWLEMQLILSHTLTHHTHHVSSPRLQKWVIPSKIPSHFF